MTCHRVDLRAHRALVTRGLVPAAAFSAIAALALTGCASGSKAAPGSGSTSSVATSSPAASTPAASTPTSTSTSTTTSSSSTGSSSAALAGQLARGIDGITSAHLTGRITSSVAAASGTISADEKLSNGKVTAVDLSEKIGGQSVRLILLGTEAWAKLPTTAGSKPWLKVTATSTNPTIRLLAASLANTSAQTSLDGEVAFARAASEVRELGHETVDGASTTHYTLVVLTAKLPATKASRALSALGVRSIPTQMWIDGKGRPVRVTEKVTARSITSTTTLDLTRYNQPVSISAPPAAQVGG